MILESLCFTFYENSGLDYKAIRFTFLAHFMKAYGMRMEALRFTFFYVEKVSKNKSNPNVIPDGGGLENFRTGTGE